MAEAVSLSTSMMTDEDAKAIAAYLKSLLGHHDDSKPLRGDEPVMVAGIATFDEDALDYIFRQTEGYPYFLQQYGKYAWDVASAGRITKEDARVGGREAQQRLDDGFYQVRYERASAAERDFLSAMSRCAGPPYAVTDVTQELGKADQRSISVRRSALIKKGLIYVPRHGTVDFTVPRFADYLHRRAASQ